MSELNPEELAEAAKAPGTFSIIAALQERAYPTDDVIVYLDEQSAYLAALAENDVKEATEALDVNREDAEAQAKFDAGVAKRDELLESLKKSRYVFVLKGISEGRREELLVESMDKFPMQYEEAKNPFTGEVTKTEVTSRERDRLFTNSIWAENIEKIVAPDGSVQDGVTVTEVEQLRSSLPLAATGAINQAIEKLRAATAVFMYSVDEDFLAKS